MHHLSRDNVREETYLFVRGVNLTQLFRLFAVPISEPKLEVQVMQRPSWDVFRFRRFRGVVKVEC